MRLGVGIFYLCACLFALAALITAGTGLIALLGLCLYAVHLVRQLRRIDGASPAVALALFRSNWHAGLILFAGIAIDGWIGRLPL